MPSASKPYLIIEENIDRQPYDECFLIYCGRQLAVTVTEYAVLQGLLSADGLQLEEASEEREALNRKGESAFQNLNRRAASTQLKNLRRKLKNEFPDLVIPEIRPGKKSENSRPLKLYTQAEIDELHYQIKNPAKNAAYVIYDEHDRAHLLVNGHEIYPSRAHTPKIDQQSLALFCMMLFGRGAMLRRVSSQEFRTTWKDLTGAGELKKPVLSTRLNGLRRALEPAGWTITLGTGKTRAYELIPCTPT